MPKVSVIIPVYNVEKYLRQCLDSVINQTLKDIEIICVDDSSTDNSLKILEEYASKDGRVKVLNQKNSGAGAARNLGMGIAKGVYLSFIDADDFIDPKMYEILYEKIEENSCDIAICNFQYTDKNGCNFENENLRLEYQRFEKCGEFSYETHPFEVLNRFQHAPWNKLFRADFIKENKIKFHELKRANDLFFVRCAMVTARRICCTNDKLIFYRLSDTSLQGTNYNNPYCIIETLCALKEFMVQKGLYQKLLSEFKYLIIGDIDYTIRSIKGRFFAYIKFVNYIKKNVLKKLDLNKDEIKIYPPIKVMISRIFNLKNGRDGLHKTLTLFGFDFKLKRKKKDKNLSLKKAFTPFVSVIICNYNGEEYLEKCLKSVIGQSLQNIEIICVDDGSTDNSLHILEKYAAIDDRIKVISQKNQGQGAARNNALKIAKGNYIAFVDSDDWLRLDALSKLYYKAKANKLDMLSFGGVDIKKETMEEVYNPYHNFVYLPENIKTCCFNYKTFGKYIHRMAVSSCLTAYRRKFLEENNIRFPDGICFEDNIFFTNALFLAKKCGILREVLYYRLLHAGQITANKKIHFGDQILMVKKMKNLMDELNIPKEIKVKYIINYVNNARSYYMNLNNKEKQPFKDGMLDILKFYDVVFEDKYYDFWDKIASVRKSPSCKQICIFGFKIRKKKKNIEALITQKETFSVIICNYNGEEYLEKCLKSVIGQSLQNIEIICVDDGSTDNSLHILEKYAAIDDRIKVISQKNQGQGAARNNALKIAKGNYIAFVDSDDWLRLDALSKLYYKAKANKLDMLSFGGVNVLKETMEEEYNPYYAFEYLPKNFKTDCFDYKKARKFLLKMAVSTCLTVYKRSFLEENSIKFPEGIYFEDNIFFTKALFLAKRCGILKETLYYRLIHQSQVTSNKTKHFGDYILMVKKMKELMDELDIESRIKVKYIIKYVDLATSYYKNLEEKEAFMEGINEILEFSKEVIKGKQ